MSVVGTRWRLVAGLIGVLAGAVGWFLLSWLVMNATPDGAANEAIGVAFGLLIAISAVGAALKRRRTDSTNQRENGENSS